jgi:hypothetical protein
MHALIESSAGGSWRACAPQPGCPIQCDDHGLCWQCIEWRALGRAPGAELSHIILVCLVGVGRPEVLDQSPRPLAQRIGVGIGLRCLSVHRIGHESPAVFVASGKWRLSSVRGMAFSGRGPVLQSVPDEIVIITLKLSGVSHALYLSKPVCQPPPCWRPAAGPGKCTAGGSGFALITTRAGGITLVPPAR